MNTDIEKETDAYISGRRYRQINSVLLCMEDELLAARYYNGFHADRKNEIMSVAKSTMSVCAGIALGQETYIRQAASPLRCNPGYGFLWWIWGERYGCRGYGGQGITVIPDKNAVIVTQATRPPVMSGSLPHT